VNSNPKIGDSNLYAHFKVTNLSYALNYQPDNLDTNVKYSFVVYATNSAGTSYGVVKTFTPNVPIKPTVNTVAADTISMTRASVGRIIVDQGSSPVTESGVIYALTDANPDPQIGDGNSVQLDSGSFTYAHQGYHSYRTYIENLTPGTEYSLKAYAINSVGTSYGELKTFTTLKDYQSITFAALANKTYGNADFNLEATSSSGLTVSYTSSNTAVATVSGNTVTIVGAGTTNITASQAGNTTYYAATDVVQQLTVNKATLTANAVYKTKTYGDENPAFNILYTGFKNGETAEVLETAPIASCTATTSTKVGSETIDVSAGSDTNYTINSIAGILNIDKATLTATADAKSREYGEANPVFTIAYAGFKGSDSISDLDTAPTAGSTATGTTNVGTADITVSGGTDNNYTIAKVKGGLTISKATLIVTAKNTTIEYGDNFSIDFEYGAFKNGEDASVLDTGAYVYIVGSAPYNVGTYTIVPDAVVDNNYTPSYVNGTLTINKAPLNVTAEAKSKTYGDANPAFTITYSGFKNSETVSVIDTVPTAITTATTSTNAGTATISVSGGSDDNYIISYTSGTLTISKASLIVTAKNTTVEYGENFSIDFEYGAFKNGDDASVLDTGAYVYIDGAFSNNVGTYTIVPDAVVDNNYTPSYVSGTLTINKATLTATADDKSREYGDANPIFTISYSGFKNGDDSTDLDTVSTTSTPATVTSDAGIYDITLSDGFDTNYTITETKGVLIIRSILPSVVTNVVTNIAGVTATFNGEMTSTGGELITTRGFVYSVTNMIPTLSDSKVDVATGIGSFIKNEAGLTSETTYYIRAFATNSKGTAYGDVKEFTTLDITPPTAPIVTNIDTYTCANNTSITADTTLVFNGSAEPGSTVEVFVSTVSVGITITDNTGNWSFDHSATVLADGVHNITATATDISTNTSKMSATLIIIIDTRDFDEDGNPDFCDDDDDNDGVLDADDNSHLPNPDQADTNNNGIGDVQEDCDNDGILNYYDTDVASCQEPILKKKTYGFSPNGDGINDVWTIEDIQLFPNNVVQIFNRSGKVVFKMNGYDNTFEGAFKGEKLPVGPYLFIIDLGNGSQPTKGWIYINY
jgi:gliding motility-associated-like protein